MNQSVSYEGLHPPQPHLSYTISYYRYLILWLLQLAVHVAMCDGWHYFFFESTVAI